MTLIDTFDPSFPRFSEIVAVFDRGDAELGSSYFCSDFSLYCEAHMFIRRHGVEIAIYRVASIEGQVDWFIAEKNFHTSYHLGNDFGLSYDMKLQEVVNVMFPRWVD